MCPTQRRSTDLALAYRDTTTGRLRLALDWGAGWQGFDLGSAGATGESDLAWGPDGRLLVVHRDGSANRVFGHWVTIENALDDDCDGR